MEQQGTYAQLVITAPPVLQVPSPAVHPPTWTTQGLLPATPAPRVISVPLVARQTPAPRDTTAPLELAQTRSPALWVSGPTCSCKTYKYALKDICKIYIDDSWKGLLTSMIIVFYRYLWSHGQTDQWDRVYTLYWRPLLWLPSPHPARGRVQCRVLLCLRY